MIRLNWRSYFVVTIAMALTSACATTEGLKANSLPMGAQPRVSIAANEDTDSQSDLTLEALLKVKQAISFCVSPKDRSIAVLVSEADHVENTYRLTWYINSVSGDHLRFAGNGGDPRLYKASSGQVQGELYSDPCQWSPSGEWFAYTALSQGVNQLWRSRVDGRVQQQVTRGDTDVLQFAWGQTDSELFMQFSEKPTPQLLIGNLLSTYSSFADIVHPGFPAEGIRVSGEVQKAQWNGQNWELKAELRTASSPWDERRNENADQYRTTGKRYAGTIDAPPSELRSNMDRRVTIYTTIEEDPEQFQKCQVRSCYAKTILGVWLNEHANQIVFWRRLEGSDRTVHAFYSWDHERNEVNEIYAERGEKFKFCDLSDELLLCVRETPDRPEHVVAIDIRTRRVDVVLDLNPEFASIQLPEIAYFEWSSPDPFEFGYPKRLWGFIVIPPSYDPNRKYPVFVSPYNASGFTLGDTGNEHPLLAYAMHGFIVINSQFPLPEEFAALGSTSSGRMKRLYSKDMGFPHMETLSRSTLAAIDEASRKVHIDEDRIGMGGVSHGAFIPLYILQKTEVIAALSVSAGSWSDIEYYSQTRNDDSRDWRPASQDYWAEIDLAEHTESVSAPVLSNTADREAHYILKLNRKLTDAGKPFEAHIYPDEYHVKWQPAHRYSIYRRNVQWFLFWLKGEEVDDPVDPEQYIRWRQLRVQHEANPGKIELTE